jgi:hypothetical protein
VKTTGLLRFNSAFERNPAIGAWMKEHAREAAIPRIEVLRRCSRLVLVLCLIPLLVPARSVSDQDAVEESIHHELVAHSTQLRTSGKALLLQEANAHQYFMLGELHGEVEIPQLIADLWPALWREGYRHVAAEISPWVATLLEKSTADASIPIIGLWTREQASTIRKFARPREPVLWGCDIEEIQPDQLIRRMARLNPQDSDLHKMVDLISAGYSRKQAANLLRLAESEHPAQDVVPGGESLWASTLNSLRVEALRANTHTRYEASGTRERVMKELFLSHSKQEPEGKVLLRFGRNHLHRGYDARGVSTLGNFVSEWAIAQGRSVFNVGVFAAGGKEHLAGETFDADERSDEPAFALLASLAGSDPSIYDLRPLRPLLHSIPPGKRTALEANLLYWADGYDLLLCYPTVSPLL